MALEDDIKGLGEEFGRSAGSILQGTAGYKEILQFTLGVKAASTALGLFGETSTKVGKEIEEVGKAFTGLYEKSNIAQLSLQVLTDVMNKDFAKAIGGITKELKGAADGAQLFQVELVKYGQDLSFQKAIGEQAFALASLGIKYSDLKKANTDLIDSYNASIRISDAQSKSFEDNRVAMSQLIAFNEKFGVTSAETIKVLDFTKNTMGGGTQQAIKFSEQLEKFADVTGQKVSKVFGDFTAGLDRFSVMSSENAIKQFEKIQATAARTGETFNNVLKSIEKFDEIDKGFEAGGQLNRVLSFMGGSFDTFAAIQADDAERARMIYEAISGVSDKYGQLTSDVAKRNFAKQIQEATGVDMKTVVGLLNKSTDLGKDIAEIGKMPLVTDAFTDKERTEKLTQLTTSKEFAVASGQLLEATKGIQVLADNLRVGSRGMAAQDTAIIKALDKAVLTPLFTGKITGDFKTAFADVGTTIKNALTDPATVFNSAAGAFTNAVANFQAIANARPTAATYPAMPSPTAANATAQTPVSTGK